MSSLTNLGKSREQEAGQGTVQMEGWHVLAPGADLRPGEESPAVAAAVTEPRKRGVDYRMVAANGSARSSATETRTVNGEHAWDNLGWSLCAWWACSSEGLGTQ